MKPKKKHLISLFFSILILSLFLVPNNANAVLYGDYLTDGWNDTFIFSYEDYTHGNLSMMYTGYNTGYRRILVEHNTTGITETAPYVYLKLTGEFHQTEPQNLYYVNFILYEITESWSENSTTWTNCPSFDDYFDVINVTVHDDLETFDLYLDISDSWDEFVGTSFASYYGYMVYMERENNYSFFECDSFEGSYSPIIYYSQFELNTDGIPEEQEEEPDETSDLMLNLFLYGILFIAIPLSVSVYTGSIGNSFNPSLGLVSFIGAETLMGAICLKIGFIDIWFMTVLIIMDVLLIVAMVKYR